MIVVVAAIVEMFLSGKIKSWQTYVSFLGVGVLG